MEKVFSDIIVFPNLGEVACDPAANPSDCPYDRQCKDLDGDGQSTCVCDSRYYTTHTNGHCVLGISYLVCFRQRKILAFTYGFDQMKQHVY